MLKKHVKVTICGHFAFGKDLLNGQTVKTKTITNEIEKHISKKEIYKIDTHGGKKKIFNIIKEILGAKKNSENILILPAQNGLRIIAPVLALGKFKNSVRLHYVVIGGWLPSYIKNKPLLTWCLKKFHHIYVETNSMKMELKAQGFDNVCVMHNCKNLKIVNEDELVYPKFGPYKLCTFSRVMKEKGIENAIAAVSFVNEKYKKDIFCLDIYGEIENSQIDWFETLKRQFPSYVNYKGKVPYDKSTEVLKEYYAVLFPTFYEGEGFAGTLIDSLASGVPVIASDWKYNSEIIENGKTGMIFPAFNNEKLVCALIKCYENKEMWILMKKKCLDEAQKYLPQNAMKKLFYNIEKK